MEKILYEFPIRQMEFYIPKWVELLPVTHHLKADLLEHIRNIMKNFRYIRDIYQNAVTIDSEYVSGLKWQMLTWRRGSSGFVWTLMKNTIIRLSVR